MKANPKLYLIALFIIGLLAVTFLSLSCKHIDKDTYGVIDDNLLSIYSYLEKAKMHCKDNMPRAAIEDIDEALNHLYEAQQALYSAY